MLKQSEYCAFMQTDSVLLPNGIEMCYEVGGKESDPVILLIMG